MMLTNKPREFYLRELDEWFADYCTIDKDDINFKFFSEKIHVIEKSAYTALQKKVADAESKARMHLSNADDHWERAVNYDNKNKDIQAKLDLAVEAYEHLKFLDQEYDKEYVDDVYRRIAIRHTLSTLKKALQCN